MHGLDYRDSCREVFGRNGILTVIGMYLIESVLFVKKSPDLFLDCTLNHSYNTRNKDDLQSFKYRYCYLQRNVKFSIKSVWNKIPIHIKNLPTNQLKDKIKPWLASRAYYSLADFFNDATGL